MLGSALWRSLRKIVGPVVPNRPVEKANRVARGFMTPI
jgi:hypothetical protein